MNKEDLISINLVVQELKRMGISIEGLQLNLENMDAIQQATERFMSLMEIGGESVLESILKKQLRRELSMGAMYDESEQYRYSLLRVWDKSRPRVVFIMLNPSVADERCDDDTIKRCIKFAKENEYGSLEVVNLFAYRATHPSVMKRQANPIGVENDYYILQAVNRSEKIVVAWGEDGKYRNRDIQVIQLLEDKELYCLGVTKDRKYPRHPLYVKADVSFVRFNPIRE